MDDLISRQAAIRWVKTECNPYGKPTLEFESGKKVIEHLEQMPAAQPEPKWIPCSERLPDELAEVNITWINTNHAPYYEFTKGKLNTGSAVYYKGRWYWYSAVCADYLAEYGFSPNDDMDDAIKVIAWMPLPEPYKEEQE